MQRPDRGAALARRISDYLDRKAASRLPPDALEALRSHLAELCVRGRPPPGRGRGLDWRAIARATGVHETLLAGARDILRPGLQALRRDLRAPAPTAPGPRRKRRPPRAPILEHPPALAEAWTDPPELHAALDLHMRRHGDNPHHLTRALRAQGLRIDETTLSAWRRGVKAPGTMRSFDVLLALEDRWRLPSGYFRSKHPNPAHGLAGGKDVLAGLEPRDCAWHLPDDFHRRPSGEQAVIAAWVRDVVLAGATDYRRFQAAAVRRPYSLRFPGLQSPRPSARLAPPRLVGEVRELMAFKTADFAAVGRRRAGVWSQATAEQKTEHLSLLFGALAAPPKGPRRGHGVPVEELCLGHLAFPRVLDWQVEWRLRGRGFYTRSEVSLARLFATLAHPRTGWLPQAPHLAERLVPIDGLVSAQEIAEARADWTGACSGAHAFADMRASEIARLAHVHHDPFETVLPILEAPSPVGEYRKIADEVLRLAPCPLRFPRAAAESARAYLMIRLGLHLGFRARNLRELMVTPRGALPRTPLELARLRRGELRWNVRENGWEVFAPREAFKNARSSFFAGQPFRLPLPDLAGLHGRIDDYLERHRPTLLGGTADPGTFFVKAPTIRSRTAAYDETGFYRTWRTVIERYGVHNPWTGRGAIAGVLPHGPHKVRDVLATHVLKHTGSFEQAGYAIQDSARTIAACYARFLPKDKAAIAAEVLNRAWEG